jgi:hypothetical protein
MSYEQDIAAWKAKHGITPASLDAPDPEELMVVADAKRPGKDYCVHCAERFKIADMRLISRSDDPYIQCDEEPLNDRQPWHIPVQHRCRACKPCFKEHYETD